MRKSRTRAGFRPFRVGVATAATAAVVVAGTATAASAATVDSVLTSNKTQVATQGGTSVTLTGASNTLSVAADLPFRVWMTTAATCSTSYPTSSSTYVLASSSTTPSGETVTFDTPAVAAGNWRFCLYDSNATPVLGGHTTTTVLAVPYSRPSASNGPDGGGNIVTLTAPDGTFGTTVTTTFNTALCPSTYAAVSTTNIAATAKKTTSGSVDVTVPKTLTSATGYYICVYNGASANISTLASRSDVTYATYATTLPTVAVNPVGGDTGGTNTITLTTAADTITGTTPGVLFARNTCPTTYAAGAGAEPFAATGTVTKISSGKVAATVPTDVKIRAGESTTPWNVCLYSSTAAGSLLALPAAYIVAPALDVASATVAPAGGPAQGGLRVTVSGLTGIPTAAGALLQASLGGSPLTDLKVIDATSFSGVTSTHSPGAVNLSVTTAAGTKIEAVSGSLPFAYTYGIDVVPNTAASGDTPVVDIAGAGFSTLTFEDVADGVALTAADAHVLLTDNAWNSQNFTGGLPAFGTAAGTDPVSYCNTVLPISDTEIVCTLDLANTLDTSSVANTPVIVAGPVDVPAGTYSVTVTNAATSLNPASYNFSIVSSGSTFTVAPF